jgi:hypothetical protein
LPQSLPQTSLKRESGVHSRPTFHLLCQPTILESSVFLQVPNRDFMDVSDPRKALIQ